MNIHPSACVESGAELGSGVEVHAHAYVGPHVEVGEDCIIGHGCHLEGRTRLGRGNILHPYVSLGTPPQDMKYHGEPTELVVGCENVFREFVSINTGTPTGGGVTRVGDRNYLMISSHIGHDCEVEDEVILVNGVLVGGHCKLESGAKLMGGAAVNPFVSVGKLAFVGGLSRIVQDVPPFMIVEGNPAKVRRVNEVGLQRAGYTEEAIERLHQTYKRIYRTKKLNRSKVFDEIEDDADSSEEALYLVEFLRRSLQGRSGRYREGLRHD
jgi:UDP-N-acetylglucosamine acyltransferase